MFDLPVDIALLAMSFVPQQVSVSLTGLGMPGCDWHVGLDATALLVGQNGVAPFSLDIPSIGSLVGLRFQHQALVLDPGAANSFGAVVSDAMEGVVGYR